LGQQSTDSGTVPNLKWRFSDSKTRIYPGGWVREQVDNDLPQSHDIAAAQQHLKKGAIRELHWHRVVRCILLLVLEYFADFGSGGMGSSFVRPRPCIGSR
jgi:hypothetical protein